MVFAFDVSNLPVPIRRFFILVAIYSRNRRDSHGVYYSNFSSICSYFKRHAIINFSNTKEKELVEDVQKLIEKKILALCDVVGTPVFYVKKAELSDMKADIERDVIHIRMSPQGTDFVIKYSDVYSRILSELKSYLE